MQQSLLPNEVLDSPVVSIAWDYTPCEELAGDFLNYAQLDEHMLCLYVVDVCGHGAASALLAVAIGRVLSSVVSATSLLVRLDPFTGKRAITPPAVVVGELNKRFPMESQGDLHFTILYGVLDLRTKLFRYACAGHPQPVHLPKGQPALFAPGEGLAVGWVDDVEFDEFTLQLAAGDRLLLYSDGEDSDQTGINAAEEELNKLFAVRSKQALPSLVFRVAPFRFGRTTGLSDDFAEPSLGPIKSWRLGQHQQ